MNDLLFYALLIALFYYFFIYLPQQKKHLAPVKLTQSQATQTKTQPPEDNQELEKTLDQLIKNIQQLNKSLK
jgi:hypothetical protein